MECGARLCLACSLPAQAAVEMTADRPGFANSTALVPFGAVQVEHGIRVVARSYACIPARASNRRVPVVGISCGCRQRGPSDI
jgi:hypothetical protein